MLIKKSITIKKHRTSISLEKEFWNALEIVALQKSSTIERIISDIDLYRNTSLASSTRVFILQYFLQQN
ncbi:ribbon-helix-helix domain-containing protein [Alphaproteobacteria bacterium]|nr:ribbon-helix-helix domain-containing protein [Alphaproteobacteria bacterium]